MLLGSCQNVGVHILFMFIINSFEFTSKLRELQHINTLNKIIIINNGSIIYHSRRGLRCLARLLRRVALLQLGRVGDSLGGFLLDK